MAAPKKMKERARMEIFVDASKKERLVKLADRYGRPWSELVREGIDLIIAKLDRRGKKR